MDFYKNFIPSGFKAEARKADINIDQVVSVENTNPEGVTLV
jgi:hypothetical protein